VIFFSKKHDFCNQNGKNDPHRPKIGQNKLLALSNFSPHRFLFHSSFLTILWPKMAQILAKKKYFWPPVA
jgi:hypothetical protein